MNTIIFTTSNHPYANKIINKLLQVKSLKVVCITESNVLYPNKSKVAGLIKYLRVSGFEYVFLQILKITLIRIGKSIYSLYPNKQPNHILADYRTLAKSKGITIIKESNINSLVFEKKIKRKKVDLFISVFFNQIFKESILSIPKLTTINIHPALLPSYKGISPTFWVLAKGESETGATIHTIDNSQIDKGSTLYQATVKISPEDTEHSLYIKCINSVLPSLEEVINTVSTATEKIKHHKNISSYYSLPTKEAIRRFKENGRKFYNFRELFYER